LAFISKFVDAAVADPGTLAWLSSTLREQSQVQRDAGGRQRVMWGFDMLVRLLADNFAKATRRPAGVTWNEHCDRYEGQFFDLVNQVLQIPFEFTEHWQRPFSAPKTNKGRGKYVQRVLRHMEHRAQKPPGFVHYPAEL
jgi:hypothetical protein